MVRKFQANHGHLWDQIIDQSNPDDLMVLIYTSGTTGPPKGAMGSHANFMYHTETIFKVWPLSENDEQLSFLPLCHILERMVSILIPLRSCATISFAEGPDTVPENIRELSPTIFVAVPRIWEKFYSAIVLQAKEATAFGKWAYHTAFKVADSVAAYRVENKPIPTGLAIMYWIAKKIVLNNTRRMMGLDRLNLAGTGAAPISPDLIRWYQGLGIDMIEGYGQTESTGIVTSNRVGKAKVGTIGQAVPGCEIKISEEGEILIRGPGVFPVI